MSTDKRLFYLLLLFLPSQLGLHFWPAWSYVIGRRIDYLSPTIYFTDVLIFFLIIFNSKNTNIKKIFHPRSLIIIFIAFIIIILNIFVSCLPFLAAYKWLKILEFSLLGLYVIKNINLKKDWQNLIKTLSIGIIFESSLSMLQFLNQSSINGIFYWLGERSFTISTPSIAKTTLDGVLFLRPYGTFPHPNALGGYLAVLLPIVLAVDFKPTKIKWLAFVLGLSALFLTFSRTAFVLGSLGILIAWFLEKRKYKLILVFLVCFVVFMTQNIYLEKESIDRRISLNNTGLEMFEKKPLFGVGLGNFIPNLPIFSKDKEVVRFLQPAHNIYLLTLAEVGFFGFITFIAIIIIIIKTLLAKKNLVSFLILNSLFIILILGMFDHYFITLQQTQLLFTIILSLSLVKYPHEV